MDYVAVWILVILQITAFVITKKKERKKTEVFLCVSIFARIFLEIGL